MEAKLAAEKKVLDEKLVKENLMLKLIEEEEKPLFKSASKEKEVNLNIVAANQNASEQIIDKKVNELITKHKQTVSEEQQKGQGVISGLKVKKIR